MKRYTLSALSAAILAASSAHASQWFNMETQPFFDDATLDIHLRNYYRNNDANDEGITDKDDAAKSQSSWAQAVRMEFSSGYLHNLIGIDLGADYALKLKGKEDRSSTGLLPIDSEGKSHGFGHTSYALRVNLFDMGEARYGRMFVNTPLLNDSDSRALSSLTEGFYAEGHFGTASMYGLWANKHISRDQSGSEKYGYIDTSTGKTKSEPVKIIGSSYDFGHGIHSNIAVGQQDERIRRYFTEVNYLWDGEQLSIDLGAQYARNEHIGKAKDFYENNSNESINQDFWGASTAFYWRGAKINLTYAQVDKSDIFDEFYYQWNKAESTSTFGSGMDYSNDNSSFFGYNDSQISSFNQSGQRSWGIHASYDFDQWVEGLKISAAYVEGKVHPKDNDEDKWKEKEYNLSVDWYVPMVEGLSGHIQYGHNTQEEQGRNSTDSDKKDIVTKDTRVIIKYDIAVF
ncbi:Porin D [invertebrate metagenome]|uniref:Porin D n=1 Tax=invertebrate metagenome TaxID=1711999 RepID=A0A2H9T6N8_9ZZZZ